jgi:hypothetical protein
MHIRGTLGFDLGIDHVWWAQLSAAKDWTAAGNLTWKIHLLREFLQERTLAGAGLAVIEFPEEYRPGYGHRGNVNWGGRLLANAGELAGLARSAGLQVLTPACSEIRMWAARNMPTGQIFNWETPDRTIAAWFRGHGAEEKQFARSGPLSNRDKRDAMLAAEFGAASTRAGI